MALAGVSSGRGGVHYVLPPVRGVTGGTSQARGTARIVAPLIGRSGGKGGVYGGLGVTVVQLLSVDPVAAQPSYLVTLYGTLLSEVATLHLIGPNWSVDIPTSDSHQVPSMDNSHITFVLPPAPGLPAFTGVVHISATDVRALPVVGVIEFRYQQRPVHVTFRGGPNNNCTQMTQAIPLIGPVTVYSNYPSAKAGGTDPGDPNSGYVPPDPAYVSAGLSVQAQYRYTADDPVVPAAASYAYLFDWVPGSTVVPPNPGYQAPSPAARPVGVTDLHTVALSNLSPAQGATGDSVSLSGGGLLAVDGLLVDGTWVAAADFTSATNVMVSFVLPVLVPGWYQVTARYAGQVTDPLTLNVYSAQRALSSGRARPRAHITVT
jgi:hypothetical protein